MQISSASSSTSSELQLTELVARCIEENATAGLPCVASASRPMLHEEGEVN